MSCKNRLDVSEIRVGDVMTRDVTTIRLDESVHGAMESMIEQRIAALPVVNHAGICLGMISRSDLSELFMQLDDQFERLADEPMGTVGGLSDGYRTLVREVMTGEPIVARGDQRLIEAAAAMSRGQCHHLPVVDDAGYLVGIISSLDVVKAVASLAKTSACRCSSATHALG